jgi:VWFA-related protein
MRAQDTRPQESGLTIKTTTQEVALDLIVRDSHGKIVKNLKATDVEITEDGVKQELRSFRAVSGQAEPGGKKGKSEKTDLATTKPMQLPATNVVCFVFHNLGPVPRRFAISAAGEFIKNDLAPGTWLGAFTLGANGRLIGLHPFTTNRDEMVAAIQNAFAAPTADFGQATAALQSAAPNIYTINATLVGNPSAGGTVVTNVVHTGGEINNQANNGADVGNSAGEQVVRGEMADQRREFGDISGRQQMDQINGMIEQLASLPGRKTVLFMSSGFTTNGDADQFQKLVERANKAEVTVYALDATGLSQNSNVVAGNAAVAQTASVSQTQSKNAGTQAIGGGITASTGGSVGQMAEKSRQGTYLEQAVRGSDTQAPMRALSESTGGFLIANTNDLKKPFQKLVEDVSTRYEAVYAPAAGKFDGHFREIKVKLSRSDWTVENRKGYFAIPDLNGWTPAPFETAALGVLSASPMPKAFDFSAHVLQYRPQGANSQRELAIEIPGSAVTATAEPDAQRHRLHVSVLALIKDSNGQIVDKVSRDTPYQIPDANLAAAHDATVPYYFPVSLPPGHYTADVAVLDREANRASVQTLQIDNPEHKGVGISSVVLVEGIQPVQGQYDPNDPFEVQAGPTQTVRITPSFNTKLKADAKPAVYFVVYPNAANSEKPKLHVELLVGGQLRGKQDADLPPANASGMIPMQIPAPARPGECELRLTAVQGGETSTQSVKYTIGGSGN